MALPHAGPPMTPPTMQPTPMMMGGYPQQLVPVKIYNAVYSSVQVYECMVRGIAVMRRRADSYVNATQILKVAGVDKGRRTKILEKEILPGKHEIVQGGYGKYQGTWIPLERGRDVAIQYGVAPLLAPLFEFVPAQNTLGALPSSLQQLVSLPGRAMPLPHGYPAALMPSPHHHPHLQHPLPHPPPHAIPHPQGSLAPAPIMPGSALRLLAQGRAQGLFTPSMSGTPVPGQPGPSGAGSPSAGSRNPTPSPAPGPSNHNIQIDPALMGPSTSSASASLKRQRSDNTEISHPSRPQSQTAVSTTPSGLAASPEIQTGTSSEGRRAPTAPSAPGKASDANSSGVNPPPAKRPRHDPPVPPPIQPQALMQPWTMQPPNIRGFQPSPVPAPSMPQESARQTIPKVPAAAAPSSSSSSHVAPQQPERPSTAASAKSSKEQQKSVPVKQDSGAMSMDDQPSKEPSPAPPSQSKSPQNVQQATSSQPQPITDQPQTTSIQLPPTSVPQQPTASQTQPTEDTGPAASYEQPTSSQQQPARTSQPLLQSSALPQGIQAYPSAASAPAQARLVPLRTKPEQHAVPSSSRPHNGTTSNGIISTISAAPLPDDGRQFRYANPPSGSNPVDKKVISSSPKRALVLSVVLADEEKPDDLVRLLLREPSPDCAQDIDLILDADGHTALHVAAALGRVATVDALLKAGADPHRGNFARQTPLIRAVLAPHCHQLLVFAEILLRLHMTIRTLDGARRGVLHHVSHLAGIRDRIPSALAYLEHIFMWIAEHQDGDFKSIVDLQDENGDTALNIAATAGNRLLVKMFLEVGASKLIPNRLGLRPGDFGVEGLDAPVTGDESVNAYRGNNQLPITSSQNVISDLSTLVKSLGDEFSSEMNSKLQTLSETEGRLRAATRKTAEQRRLTNSLQKQCDELEQNEHRIRNLERALIEEKFTDWSGRTENDVDPAFRMHRKVGLVHATVDVPDALDAAPTVPTEDSAAALIRMRRLKMWYARTDKLLEARMAALKGVSAEKEFKFKKLVSLAAGVPTSDVDNMLESLLIALDSEKEPPKLERVTAFMHKVNDGIV